MMDAATKAASANRDDRKRWLLKSHSGALQTEFRLAVLVRRNRGESASRSRFDSLLGMHTAQPIE